MKNDVLNIRGVFAERFDDSVAEFLTLLIPRAFLQVIWRVLNKARHDVLARRRDRRIGQTGNNDIDVWPARVTSVFGVIVSAFHVLHAGRYRDRPTKVGSFAGK